MPIFKNRSEDMDGWLSTLLALRMRQIEESYPGGTLKFVKTTGISKGTLYFLKTGKGNPTLGTIEKLASDLNMSVWSLVGRSASEKLVARDLAEFDLSYQKISELVAAARIVKRSFIDFPAGGEGKGEAASGQGAKRAREEGADGWLAILLAFRLRQIESAFPGGTKAFQNAAGLSSATLHHLKTAQGNPTIVTIERLARHLDVPVWSLIGRSADRARVAKEMAEFDLSYDEVDELIAATRIVKRSLLARGPGPRPRTGPRKAPPARKI